MNESDLDIDGAIDAACDEALNAEVQDHVSLGCHEMGDSLGIQKMPDGYALMLNADETHFYWLRYDGVESVISWDKWAIYRGARSDKRLVDNAPEGEKE